MSLRRATSISALAEATPTYAEVDGVPLCLVRFGDEVRAVHDVCSHQEWSLSDGGMVFDRGVECSLHGSTFSLDDGQPSSLPATKPVPTYAVEVAGDDVLIDVSTSLNGAPTPDH